MSAIEWTDETWNPVTGCSKVSPGCAHCYAETLTMRHAKNWGVPGLPWTPENAEQNVQLRPERLDKPLGWRKPRMVFVNSMSDLFHELVPYEYIRRVFDVMRLCDGGITLATGKRRPRHTFQVLTKRPERMRDLARSRALGFDPDNPPENIWLGTSIENGRFVERADYLRETPAAIRFISAEPLLGPLVYDTDIGMRGDHPGPADPRDIGDPHTPCWSDYHEGPELDLDGIDWLIVGGESGPKHRPMDPQWVRDLLMACTLACSCSGLDVEEDHHHRPAFFFKQWGGRTPKAGGRELDGRTWDEMPGSPPSLENANEKAAA